MRLSRNTLLQILKRCNKDDIRKNPQRFAVELVNVIKHKLSVQLVDGIKYTKTGEWYKMEQFHDESTGWDKYFIPSTRGLYDYVEVDSSAINPKEGNEAKFVEGLESRDDVLMYIKLPSWFTIDTPIGRYNPDWAIILEETDEADFEKKNVLYLVRETKGTTDPLDLPESQRYKLYCGEKHFKEALKVDYTLVNDAYDLRVERHDN